MDTFVSILRKMYGKNGGTEEDSVLRRLGRDDNVDRRER